MDSFHCGYGFLLLRLGHAHYFIRFLFFLIGGIGAMLRPTRCTDYLVMLWLSLYRRCPSVPLSLLLSISVLIIPCVDVIKVPSLPTIDGIRHSAKYNNTSCDVSFASMSAVKTLLFPSLFRPCRRDLFVERVNLAMRLVVSQ